MRSIEPDLVQVAVAIIRDHDGRYLVSKRQKGQHLEGLWEFPGGKVEPSENIKDALIRECHEELGIEIDTARPLISIRHRYPEKEVLLDTWLIQSFAGTPQGCEGQEIAWHEINSLKKLAMPEADKPIVTALSLPSIYQITPDPTQNGYFDPDHFLSCIDRLIENGRELIQLRAHKTPRSELESLAKEVVKRCHQANVRCLLNTSLDDPLLEIFDGVHLTQSRLLEIPDQKILKESDLKDKLIAVSCHDLISLKHAEKVGVDFAVLAPVETTKSHPQTKPIGWRIFEELVNQINLPIYALGGMQSSMLDRAWTHGAQGVACMRDGWSDTD